MIVNKQLLYDSYWEIYKKNIVCRCYASAVNRFRIHTLLFLYVISMFLLRMSIY